MKKHLMTGLLAAFCASTAFAGPAFAALKVGDTAPDFTARASLGGKEFDFSLKDALKKGPAWSISIQCLYRRLRPGSPYLRGKRRQVQNRGRQHHRRVGR